MAGASGGDLDNSTQLEGSTDGTGIGNVVDRLKVNIDSIAGGNEAIIPADEINYFTEFIRDSGSRELAVNGSSTPVEFSAGPSGTDIWYITELVITIQDGGNLDVTDYGSLPTLTNGLLIEHSLNSIDYQISNLQQNIDLAMTFSSQALEGSSQGFLNDANLFVGAFKVEPEITLKGANSDVLKATVRDDLSGLTMHRIAYRAWTIP